MNMPKNEFNTELLERVSKSEKLAYVAKFLGRYKDIYSDSPVGTVLPSLVHKYYS